MGLGKVLRLAMRVNSGGFMSCDAMQQHDLLITGFGPFPGVRRNPSARLVQALAADRAFARLGLRVKTRILTVGYGIVAEALADEARYQPRAVLMFGVAARSKRVRIELKAINRVSLNAKDAMRTLPGDARLERCEAVFRRTRAPVSAALRAMREAGVGVEYSRSAGRYVCNAAYWRALGAMPPDTLVLFVHIPLLEHVAQKWPPVLRNNMRQNKENELALMKPGTRKRDPRPDFQALLNGAKRVALAMMKAARLTP